jgi:outer membrane lipoprotein-sorting protein
MLLTLTLLTACVGSIAGRAGTLTDGRDILQKSFGTYLRMTSYYGRANTDSLLLDTNGRALKQIGTSVDIKYKRPNKLFLSFLTPVGSRVVWSNSTNLGIYDPGANKYSISTTAPNLEALLPLLFQRASVSASFDPLYALSRKELPSQLRNITLKELSNYNGHPVYVVTGDLVTKKTIHWTWCIDRNTLLLYKIEQITPPVEQQFSYKQNGQIKHSMRKVSVMLRTVVADARPNAPIADGEFDYKPPAGASQRIDLPQSSH